MSEVVDWWHRESGKSLEASGLDARGGTGRERIQRIDVQLLQRSRAIARFLSIFSPPLFLFLSLYRFFPFI